jgi:hypothetical protein
MQGTKGAGNGANAGNPGDESTLSSIISSLTDVDIGNIGIRNAPYVLEERKVKNGTATTAAGSVSTKAFIPCSLISQLPSPNYHLQLLSNIYHLNPFVPITRYVQTRLTTKQAAASGKAAKAGKGKAVSSRTYQN